MYTSVETNTSLLTTSESQIKPEYLDITSYLNPFPASPGAGECTPKV